MKTTLELNDELLSSARHYADSEGTTLRALVETGLRMALKSSASGQPKPRIRIRAFRGKTAFTPAFENADWPAIKEEARRR